MDKNNEILGFWEWFKSISDALHADMKNSDILKVLDNRIKEIGPFDWEIGPLNETVLYLAISPCLNQELMKKTIEIVGNAPSCPGWTFLYAKPSKGYSPTFNMINEYGRAIEVNTSTWMYVLFYFDDGTLDIDVKISTVHGDVKTEALAVEIALTNIIGEEKFIKLLKNVRIVNDFGSDEFNATSIKYLSNHLDKILK